jgi:hypothetical protein
MNSEKYKEVWHLPDLSSILIGYSKYIQRNKQIKLFQTLVANIHCNSMRFLSCYIFLNYEKLKDPTDVTNIFNNVL